MATGDDEGVHTLQKQTVDAMKQGSRALISGHVWRPPERRRCDEAVKMTTKESTGNRDRKFYLQD